MSALSLIVQKAQKQGAKFAKGSLRGRLKPIYKKGKAQRKAKSKSGKAKTKAKTKAKATKHGNEDLRVKTQYKGPGLAAGAGTVAATGVLGYGIGRKLKAKKIKAYAAEHNISEKEAEKRINSMIKMKQKRKNK